MLILMYKKSSKVKKVWWKYILYFKKCARVNNIQKIYKQGRAYFKKGFKRLILKIALFKKKTKIADRELYSVLQKSLSINKACI